MSKASKSTGIDPSEYDPGASHEANVARALFYIGRGVADLAYQVKYLGNGSAASQMGAIEHLAMQIKDGAEGMAMALHEVGDAIRETSGDE